MMRIIEPGLLTTVQDLGRPGHAHLGVPRSGALDARAHGLANRLVGNPESAATLETTLLGVSVEFDRPTIVAASGAQCAVTVGERQVAFATPVLVPAATTLRLGPSRQARTYLGVAGGIATPIVLGSRSMDLLSGTGGRPLVAGQTLPIGSAQAAPAPADVALATRPVGHVVRLLVGPRDDMFAESTLRELDHASYTVGSASNRIGLRLQGTALQRRDQRELASEPMVLGAVQVPPDGQPVIFLNDHPTTGGYPVVGVVHRDDLRNCAQARPGDVLTFSLSI